MVRKGIGVWIFSSLALVASIHVVESISVIIFNNQIRLLRLYPLIGEQLQSLTPTFYFLGSLTTVFILWGITCYIAFDNPVEVFLNHILSNAKKQSATEAQILDEKSELLDMINETVIMNNTLLAQVKDVMFSVRTEVKEIQPLKENVEKLKTEINRLNRETEQYIKYTNKCPTCRKPLLREFKVCPYCGENISLLPEKMISVREYR